MHERGVHECTVERMKHSGEEGDEQVLGIEQLPNVHVAGGDVILLGQVNTQCTPPQQHGHHAMPQDADLQRQGQQAVRQETGSGQPVHCQTAAVAVGSLSWGWASKQG